jgi:hypothetical protein
MAGELSSEEKALAEKMRQDSITLYYDENIENGDNWQVAYFVDDFGEPTKEKYLRYKKRIKGHFSNIAASHENSFIGFIIESDRKVCIQLYEYNLASSVKSYSNEKYGIKMRGFDNRNIELSGLLISDRIVLDDKNSKKFCEFLEAGGEVKLVFVNKSDDGMSKYYFTIPDVSGFKERKKEVQNI